MSIISRFVWFDGLSGQTERESMLILLMSHFMGDMRTILMVPKTIVMITNRKCRDQLIDLELVAQLTKHVMVSTTIWVDNYLWSSQ